MELVGTWRLAEPAWLHAAWAALAAPLVVAWWSRRRARRLDRLATRERLDELVGPRRGWVTGARATLCGLALLTLAVGLARPQSDPEEVESEQTGRNVIFLLDVSRSMLATDVAPNRLDRAKLWIDDLVSELRGDRFGLVAFAGTATVVSPLTADRGFFRMALAEVSPDSVARGGTNIGDAIRKTTELLVPAVAERTASGSAPVLHDLVLITDGEDQESLPVEAAQAAARRGVRVIALGVGSREGAVIEAGGGGGHGAVRTRLESSTLEDVALATPGGVYLEVGTGTVDLAGLYRDLIASAEQETMQRGAVLRYTERFGWFLWPALLLLLAERLVIPPTSRRAAW
jgi:Ca-activated chloride channel family protein